MSHNFKYFYNMFDQEYGPDFYCKNCDIITTQCDSFLNISGTVPYIVTWKLEKNNPINIIHDSHQNFRYPFNMNVICSVCNQILITKEVLNNVVTVFLLSGRLGVKNYLKGFVEDE